MADDDDLRRRFANLSPTPKDLNISESASLDELWFRLNKLKGGSTATSRPSKPVTHWDLEPKQTEHEQYEELMSSVQDDLRLHSKHTDDSAPVLTGADAVLEARLKSLLASGDKDDPRTIRARLDILKGSTATATATATTTTTTTTTTKTQEDNFKLDILKGSTATATATATTTTTTTTTTKTQEDNFKLEKKVDEETQIQMLIQETTTKIQTQSHKSERQGREKNWKARLKCDYKFSSESSDSSNSSDLSDSSFSTDSTSYSSSEYDSDSF
eukprot:TRINITY_DN3357_c1_g1_i1.p1 TRINITY_DN3357_c1_g1~~TRINITY_DN3357_c1_g1_i1.p1  ORF type:complete len:272 (+),score=68.78 TRINITY_DN3357_c1_g1_i1:3-818(+)